MCLTRAGGSSGQDVSFPRGTLTGASPLGLRRRARWRQCFMTWAPLHWKQAMFTQSVRRASRQALCTAAVLLKHRGLRGELQRRLHPRATKQPSQKSNSIEKGAGWVYTDESGDRKGEKERVLLISGQTFFLERLRNYSRLIPCQRHCRNFKSNGKLQRNYLNVIILILNKLNYAEDTMPLHRQWPHCCYMR